MTCHNCNSRCKKFGKHRNGLQRFRCKQCRKTFTEDHATPLGGMYTRLEDATKVIELLTEGCSISSVERLTGIHHTTILSLLALIGDKCERLLESRVSNHPRNRCSTGRNMGLRGMQGDDGTSMAIRFAEMPIALSPSNATRNWS